MKKLFALVIALAMMAIAVSAGTSDPYADAVESEYRVIDAGNALGAPDGKYATLRAALLVNPSSLVLDMGEGEEIHGCPSDCKDDFRVIEIDGREIPDCAQVMVEISGDGWEWLGLSCDSEGFHIPDGADARYVKIVNMAGFAFEVDSIVARCYNPDNVPEFTAIGAGIALLGAGLIAARRRKD